MLLVGQVDAENTTTYTVQPGDSMWKVAIRFEVGVTEIMKSNPQITNPNLIYPGQKLQIPQYDEVKKLEYEVVQLVNQERAKHGLKPLIADWELSRVARFKSADMRDLNYFDHNSPTYGSPFTMIQNFGLTYRSAAENIAAGQTDAQSVMKAWMNSPGHRQNILNPNLTHIGCGYAQGGKWGHYWTQMFILK
ncbi:SafA/ExsA family spore coat assembly protein [Ammoniphilus sp. CFH 90114]|uniref:SafA/ExsA family spore coat assembly protein n=1 Tax=Ammoniphilus sp. CFH 90114 TaxID=2493665 RepID=UPI001F0B8E4A|nr:SafA/ExsA family spore coat assembly protein [Ammoniphilus sp. CFH 90114]